MRTFNRLSVIGIAALMAASIVTARAEEGDASQTRTQDRTRAEFNLQTPDAEFGQSRNREEKMVFNKNQNAYQHQYQYKHMNQYQKGGADSASNNTNMASNAWQGSNSSSAMDRMNDTNRSMQGSSVTGSMNRSNTASRSSGGGRR